MNRNIDLIIDELIKYKSPRKETLEMWLKPEVEGAQRSHLTTIQLRDFEIFLSHSLQVVKNDKNELETIVEAMRLDVEFFGEYIIEIYENGMSVSSKSPISLLSAIVEELDRRRQALPFLTRIDIEEPLPTDLETRLEQYKENHKKVFDIHEFFKQERDRYENNAYSEVDEKSGETITETLQTLSWFFHNRRDELELKIEKEK